MIQIQMELSLWQRIYHLLKPGEPSKRLQVQFIVKHVHHTRILQVWDIRPLYFLRHQQIFRKFSQSLLIDKLQSRKSQDGTPVQNLESEISL